MTDSVFYCAGQRLTLPPPTRILLPPPLPPSPHTCTGMGGRGRERGPPVEGTERGRESETAEVVLGDAVTKTGQVVVFLSQRSTEVMTGQCIYCVHSSLKLLVFSRHHSRKSRSHSGSSSPPHSTKHSSKPLSNSVRGHASSGRSHSNSSDTQGHSNLERAVTGRGYVL